MEEDGGVASVVELSFTTTQNYTTTKTLCIQVHYNSTKLIIILRPLSTLNIFECFVKKVLLSQHCNPVSCFVCL